VGITKAALSQTQKRAKTVSRFSAVEGGLGKGDLDARFLRAEAYQFLTAVSLHHSGLDAGEGREGRSMAHLLTSLLLVAPMNPLVTYGFLAAAVPLLGFVALDLRRAAKAAAVKKNAANQYTSRYRDGNGMSVFFDTSDDSSSRSTRRF
jgi:hypothetical protein